MISKVKSALDQGYIRYQMRKHQMPQVSARFSIFVDTSRFTIKTADSWNEFLQVIKLRHEVFIREGLKKRTALRVDLDKFDFVCDHLIIVEKATSRVVGTYRLISSHVSKDYYSESEFYLKDFLKRPGTKLELGRACIHQDYRNGITMTLLWRGLVEYMKATKTDYLFGCSSIKTIDPLQTAFIYKFLQERGHTTDVYGIHPTKKYAFKKMREFLKSMEGLVTGVQGDSLVPSLLKSYLNAGAKVCGEPALDKPFHCVDFFTVLETKNISDSYERKYRTGSSS